MSKDTEIDMKDVELNEMDPEKQPMTGDGPAAGEKNGSVKQKVPEDDVKFTGLSKEELMRVAGTPGWVRTRWVLLVLFWLGWLGMLAGAIVIIVKAPRCQPIPPMNWWNEGPLYQISDLRAFSSAGLKGVEKNLDSINTLKVKGLVLGPFHTVQKDQPDTLNLQMIDPTHGSEEDLATLLEKAHKKGISVVLDITPNYLGNNAWFSAGDMSAVLEKLKDASIYWFDKGVDGVKVSGLGSAADVTAWSNLVDAVKADRTEGAKNRSLIGMVEGMSAIEVSMLLNTSGVDLIVPDLIKTSVGGVQIAESIDTMLSDNEQTSVGWGLGASKGVHLANKVGVSLVRLYQLLLLTLPGTPVFTYGDEIGLLAQGAEAPMMPWDLETAPAEGAVVNQTVEAERQERLALRKWFKALGELRGKERSLLYGDYLRLQTSNSSFAFLRRWDQSERFVTAVNWGDAPMSLSLKAPAEWKLPKQAKVKLSTDPAVEEGTMVDLDQVQIGAQQGFLLQFPYVA